MTQTTTAPTSDEAERLVAEAAQTHAEALAEARTAEAELWALLEMPDILEAMSVTAIARTVGADREGLRRRLAHLPRLFQWPNVTTPTPPPCETPGCGRPQQTYVPAPLCNGCVAETGQAPIRLVSG